MIRRIDEKIASHYHFLVLCVGSGMISTEQLQTISLIETSFLPGVFSAITKPRLLPLYKITIFFLSVSVKAVRSVLDRKIDSLEFLCAESICAKVSKRRLFCL